MYPHCLKKGLRVLFVIGCMVLAANGFAQSDERFRRILWGPDHIESDLIQYSAVFQSSGTEQSYYFLNVVRADGLWVVQNLPVGFEPGLTQIATNINANLFRSGEAYETTFNRVYVTEAPTFNLNLAVVHVLGDPTNYLVNGGACRDGHGAMKSPVRAPLQAVAFFPPPPPPLPPYRVTYNKNVPDTEQGENECGPTSAANSLSWMEDVYDDVDIGMTAEEIRDTIKGVDYMNTSAASGTSDANFVAGKNAFAADFDLPIETEAIGGGVDNAPGMEELYGFVEDGADVELSVVWLDENGDSDGGHWVTVVGMVEVEGQYGVWINDPDDGEEQAQFHWVDQNADGTSTLRGYGSNRIDLTIAESVKALPRCGLFAAGGTLNGAGILMAPLVLLIAAWSRRARRLWQGKTPETCTA